MSGLTVSGSPRIGAMVRQSFTAMTPAERTRLTAMYGAIAGLHLLGFVILFAFVVPSHYKGLGIGVAILAYTLGLRHAFDADHISAIDNTTRKVLGERQGTGKPRPFGFGFFFSLGHSSVVVAIGAAIIVAERTVFPAVSNSGSPLERFGGLFGTIVSASFLFLIGLLNLVILAGIVRVFIGGIEVLSLLTHQIAGPSRSHGSWAFLSGINLNTAGFVIVAMFIVTWLAAMLIWRYGQIEKKWTARLQPGAPYGIVGEPPAAEGGEPRVIYSLYNNAGGV
jgi:high-affinity nickel permease